MFLKLFMLSGKVLNHIAADTRHVNV